MIKEIYNIGKNGNEEYFYYEFYNSKYYLKYNLEKNEIVVETLENKEKSNELGIFNFINGNIVISHPYGFMYTSKKLLENKRKNQTKLEYQFENFIKKILENTKYEKTIKKTIKAKEKIYKDEGIFNKEIYKELINEIEEEKLKIFLIDFFEKVLLIRKEKDNLVTNYELIKEQIKKDVNIYIYLNDNNVNLAKTIDKKYLEKIIYNSYLKEVGFGICNLSLKENKIFSIKKSFYDAYSLDKKNVYLNLNAKNDNKIFNISKESFKYYLIGYKYLKNFNNFYILKNNLYLTITTFKDENYRKFEEKLIKKTNNNLNNLIDILKSSTAKFKNEI